MLSDQSQEQATRYTYQLPTRLNIEDQLICIGPFSLTLRQSFVLTTGACVATTLWRRLADFATWGELGVILRLIATATPLIIALMWAFLRLADRYLEDWAVIVIRYLTLPKCYRWWSICQQPDSYRRKVAQQWHHTTLEESEEDTL